MVQGKTLCNFPGKDILRRKAIHILIVAKDEGSVLRPLHSSDVLQLLDYITDNVTANDDDTGDIVTYEDVCLRWRLSCYDNSHAKLIAQMFATKEQVCRDLESWEIFLN